MATIEYKKNPFMEMAKQHNAFQPMQYQPPQSFNQQGQVAPQQVKPMQYTHSYDNTPVAKNGVMYNGTHNMQFGKRDYSDPSQRLDGGGGYKSLQQQQLEAQQAISQGGGNHYSRRFLGRNNPLLNSVVDRSELAMQRTVVPMYNNKQAHNALMTDLESQYKYDALNANSQYQNALLARDKEKQNALEANYANLADYRAGLLANKNNRLIHDMTKANTMGYGDRVRTADKIKNDNLYTMHDQYGKPITLSGGILDSIQGGVMQYGTLPKYYHKGENGEQSFLVYPKGYGVGQSDEYKQMMRGNRRNNPQQQQEDRVDIYGNKLTGGSYYKLNAI